MMMDDKTRAEVERRGRMPIVLDGWDRFSVWGWDGNYGCLFAQLWPNTDDSRNEPTVWITAGSRWPSTTSPCVLAEYVSMAVGCTIAEAVEALAKCAPQSVKDVLQRAVLA
jgi:hypothetical protein